MSKFKILIIVSVVYIIVIFTLSQLDFGFFDGFRTFLMGMFSIIYYGFLCMDVADLFDYKYILYSDRKGYHAKMIEPSFFLFPNKKPIKEKYHSYKTQNIFGAKSHSGYSSEITFSTEGAARYEIEERKRKIKKDRKKFFETPEKNNKNYLKV